MEKSNRENINSSYNNVSMCITVVKYIEMIKKKKEKQITELFDLWDFHHPNNIKLTLKATLFWTHMHLNNILQRKLYNAEKFE